MNENNDSELVRRPPNAVEKSKPGTKRILADMIADTVALGRTRAEKQACERNQRRIAVTDELVRIIRKAAEEGVIETTFSRAWLVATLLNSGRSSGTAARMWMEGDRYCWGRTVSKDYAEAAKWYRMAAERGDAVGQRKFGDCCKLGKGVPQDDAAAIKWFQRAAEQEDETSQTKLGICYFKGEGVPQNFIEAAKWFRKAAERGNREAQNWLGICYVKGQGVAKDVGQASRWYRIAAELDNATAQSNLGSCYLSGAGVLKDTVQAYKWFKLAAEQDKRDDSKAKKKLSALSSSMSAAELAEGEQAYDEYSKRKQG